MNKAVERARSEGERSSDWGSLLVDRTEQLKFRLPSVRLGFDSVKTRIKQKWGSEKIRTFRTALLAWYRRHKRALPWRSDATPYRVWIAEIMLQQTRVQTAVPYYDRFLSRFPNVEALAAATKEDVLEFWAGLGYYRRARNLWNAARKIVGEFGGKFPETFEGILELPGIGRYTAGAIASIAFNRPEPVVDGNVRRVIRRLHGLSSAPEGFFWQQAESWIPMDQPSDFNQAMMELGALVCVPSRPLCGSCPVRSLCRSARQGWTQPSHKSAGRAQETVEMVMLVLECKGKIVLERKPAVAYIPGAWGLPVRILQTARQRNAAARSLAREIVGSSPALHACDDVRHAITCRRILAHVYRAAIEPPQLRPAGDGRFVWFPRARLDRLLTSSLFRKGLAASAR
jgi:A/G-specific adenine glycosylase